MDKNNKTFLIIIGMINKLNYSINNSNLDLGSHCDSDCETKSDNNSIFKNEIYTYGSEFKFKNLEKPPHKIYKNIDKPEIQKEIEIQFKDKKGIYGFFCEIEYKFYIGSSESLFKRFKEHIKGRKSNIKLQRSIIKYGLENFQFIIFELCSENNKKLLTDLETQYIALFELNSLYNFKLVASSMLGYKHSNEAKNKMRIINKGENHPFFGKYHTKESKFKISLATKGNKNPMFGKNHSDFSKSLIANKLSRQVYVYEVLENKKKLVNIFSSSVKVANWLGVNKSTIGRYIKSEKIWNKKYIFRLLPICISK